MSCLTKFPSKSRIMIFEKRDRGRWLCDGRLAYFCPKTELTNSEWNLEPGVYERSKGDVLSSYESLPDFEKIRQRAVNCSTPASLLCYSEGFVLIRYDEKFPDEIRGDNYVITYESEGSRKNIFIPQKVLDFIKTHAENNNLEMFISPAEGNIMIVSPEHPIEYSGVGSQSAVIAVFNAKTPMCDAIAFN